MVINEKLGTLGLSLLFLTLLVSLKYVSPLVLIVALLGILFLVIKSAGEINEKIRFILICLLLIFLAYFRGIIVFNGFEELVKEEGSYKGQIEIIDKLEGQKKTSYIGFLKGKSLIKTLIYSDKAFNVGAIIESEGHLAVPKRELIKVDFLNRLI